MKKVFLFFTVLLWIFSTAYAGGISTNYRSALIFAYSQANSVFEDDNIKLEIYNESLWATNKTQKTLFIDLSQCFQVYNGSSFPMFEEKQDEKKASKKGVSTSIDEFISIAPATGSKQNATWICDLSFRVFREYGTTEGANQDFSDYEKRLLGVINDLLSESKNADSKKKKYVGAASRHLTEDESVANIGASIAYAFNKRSENWNSVSISTWVSDIIFAPYYVEMPTDLTKKEKRGFGVKETKPAEIRIKANSPFEFDMDKSPITVCDWEGDYKKGTFVLSNPLVEKKKVNVGKLLFNPLLDVLAGGAIDKTTYKRIICFEGANADWGKMSYVDEIKDTKQSK